MVKIATEFPHWFNINYCSGCTSCIVITLWKNWSDRTQKNDVKNCKFQDLGAQLKFYSILNGSFLAVYLVVFGPCFMLGMCKYTCVEWTGTAEQLHVHVPEPKCWKNEGGKGKTISCFSPSSHAGRMLTCLITSPRKISPSPLFEAGCLGS